jgi:uncharacterized protein YjbI with pentapeptide repeats
MPDPQRPDQEVAPYSTSPPADQRGASVVRPGPIKWTESKLWRFEEWLEKRALISILDHLAKLTLLVAIIGYFWGQDAAREAQEDARKTKHYQAWQMIHASRGLRGDGGRRDALETLVRDGVRLDGIDVSNGSLDQLRIPACTMFVANFDSTRLFFSDFAGSVVAGTSFRHATVSASRWERAELEDVRFDSALAAGIQMRGARTSRLSFHSAGVWESDFRGSYHSELVLSRASLYRSDMRSTYLREPILDSADLSLADLRAAVLDRPQRWQTISSIRLANIYGLHTTDPAFFAWAISRGAVSTPDSAEWRGLQALSMSLSSTFPRMSHLLSGEADSLMALWKR